MKHFLFFISILYSFTCFAQSSSVSFEKEIDFILYLGQNKQYNDIDFYGERLLNQGKLNLGQKDSLNFFMGFINYNRSNYDKTLSFFSRVSNESIFSPKSTFYSELCFLEKHDHRNAFNFLKSIQLDKSNSILQELKSFELSGLSLLNRDYKSFDSLSFAFKTENEILVKEYKLQQDSYTQLKKLRRKSPFIAGTLSAVVPGLGLVYAGNNGQALSAFLRVVALGALTAETYTKLGPKNPQFVVSASLFSFFYIGNIWGSVLCVQIIKDEKCKEIDNNIGVGLRIPIDNFFK